MITDVDEDRRVELVAASRRPPYLLAEAWRDYLGEHALPKGQELRRVRYTASHWLRVMGADAEVATWKRADTARYEQVRRGEGVMGTTIRREMCLQQAALNHALHWERIEKVPYFQKPSGQGAKRRPLTEEEVRRVLASKLPRRIWLFYFVALWTGHRARAIETLPWARVNFEARTIDFNDPDMRRTNKRRTDGFPMSDELYTVLLGAKRWADRHAPADPYVIGLGPRGKCSTTFHACRAALKGVGIDERGICRHAVRKTFVTERIKRGFSRNEVAALISDNPATMDKHYVGFQTEDLRAAASMKAAA